MSQEYRLCGCGSEMELVDKYASMKQRPSVNEYVLTCKKCGLTVSHPSKSTHKLRAAWNAVQGGQ